jgi:PAS domain S-box-containing protein
MVMSVINSSASENRPPAGVDGFEEVYDGLLRTALDGRIVAANHRAVLLSGFEAGALLKLNVTGLISGLRSAMLADMSRQLAPGKFAVLEGVLRRKDGVRVSVEVALSRRAGLEEFLFALRKTRPAPVAAAGDTDPRHALMRGVFQGISDAVLVTTLTGEMVEENRRARELFQYGEQQLQETSIEHIISGLDGKTLRRFHQELASGRHSLLDAMGQRRDGTAFPAEIAVSLVHVLDRNLFVFSIRNIERRRRMLELLRMEHNALQNSASGIAMSDLDGRVRFANRAFLRLWGYALVKDVVGRNIKEFWSEKDAPAQMVAVANTGGVWHGELSSSGLNGRPFFVQVSATANKDGRGRTSGLVFSFTDITDRKRAEEAIRKEAAAQMEQAREKDDFAGQLNILSVPDVMQLIESTRKSGTLTVSDDRGGVVGAVEFIEGQAVRGVCGEERGERSVYALLGRGGAGFLFKQGSPAPEPRDIHESTMGLLLEGSRLLDEARSEEAPADEIPV